MVCCFNLIFLSPPPPLGREKNKLMEGVHRGGRIFPVDDTRLASLASVIRPCPPHNALKMLNIDVTKIGRQTTRVRAPDELCSLK